MPKIINGTEETENTILDSKKKKDKLLEAFAFLAKEDYVVIKRDTFRKIASDAEAFRERRKPKMEDLGDGRYREPSLFVIYDNHFGGYIASICPGAKLSDAEKQILREGYTILKVCECPSDEIFIYCAKEENNGDQ